MGQFQADLAELGIARADLVEAGQLRNPAFSLLFPWGPKQIEATLRWPADPRWQRPRRVAAARLAADALAERLVQDGLRLIAEVKVAHATVTLETHRARVTETAAEVQRQIAEIAQARLRTGDISELEARAWPQLTWHGRKTRRPALRGQRDRRHTCISTADAGFPVARETMSA